LLETSPAGRGAGFVCAEYLFSQAATAYAPPPRRYRREEDAASLCTRSALLSRRTRSGVDISLRKTSGAPDSCRHRGHCFSYPAVGFHGRNVSNATPVRGRRRTKHALNASHSKQGRTKTVRPTGFRGARFSTRPKRRLSQQTIDVGRARYAPV